MPSKVKISDKYSLKLTDNHTIVAERYGEPWPAANPVSNMAVATFYRLSELEKGIELALSGNYENGEPCEGRTEHYEYIMDVLRGLLNA